MRVVKRELGVVGKEEEKEQAEESTEGNKILGLFENLLS